MNNFKTYKKILFKYLLIFLLLIILIHSTFILAQQSIRKIIESDRFFFFMMKNISLNLERLSEYKPSLEEKKKIMELINKIEENWTIKNDP